MSAGRELMPGVRIVGRTLEVDPEQVLIARGLEVTPRNLQLVTALVRASARERGVPVEDVVPCR